jgi:hypothetical protein
VHEVYSAIATLPIFHNHKPPPGEPTPANVARVRRPTAVPATRMRAAFIESGGARGGERSL